MCECPDTTVDVNVGLTIIAPELDPDDELDPDELDELEELAPEELELDELPPDELPPPTGGVVDGVPLLHSVAATGIRRSVVVAAVRNSRRVCMISSSSDEARSNACAAPCRRAFARTPEVQTAPGPPACHGQFRYAHCFLRTGGRSHGQPRRAGPTGPRGGRGFLWPWGVSDPMPS
jgi:hypothetical protein